MKDYQVQSGPLRTFSDLYDERFEKLRAVADFHTIQIVARPDTVRRIMAEIKRSEDLALELRFVATFFTSLNRGQRTTFGIRDVTQGKASLLARRLGAQQRLRWSRMKYGVSEDDLVIVDLQDFAGDFKFLLEFTPPNMGDMFFCLSAPFDLADIYWQRAARASAKAQDDRFRRDMAGAAHQAQVLVGQHADGSYTIVLHPSLTDVSLVEMAITAAGQKAGMVISFAPGLFS